MRNLLAERFAKAAETQARRAVAAAEDELRVAEGLVPRLPLEDVRKAQLFGTTGGARNAPAKTSGNRA